MQNTNAMDLVYLSNCMEGDSIDFFICFKELKTMWKDKRAIVGCIKNIPSSFWTWFSAYVSSTCSIR